jgi:hypothetical protein
MNAPIGQTLDVLDSPQLLIDLDIVDANLERMFGPYRGGPVSGSSAPGWRNTS